MAAVAFMIRRKQTRLITGTLPETVPPTLFSKGMEVHPAAAAILVPK